MNLDPIEHQQVFAASAAAQMERILRDLGRMYQERNEALQEVANAHHDALLRLSLAADFKDDDTGCHIMRIAFLAEELALLLGQPREFAQLLRKAAPMHDIGKIGIPDAVLKKPGPLSYEEREIMKLHPTIGARILGKSRIELFQLAAEIALRHHERFDGQGYPHGLSGLDIPLSARIVSTVDFFDALTMDRVYRKAFPDDEALSMLQAQAGGAFDPQIVQCFLEHADRMVAVRDHVNQTRPTFESLMA